MREYFATHFDLDILLNYVAIMNWSVPFDDMFQNHFYYRRLSDGKWFMTPWDLDLNFGGWKGANSSLYMGEQGDPDNRSGWWHRLKDGFLKSYRAEYEDRLLLLNNTVLHPDSINSMVTEWLSTTHQAEANAAASAMSCSFSGGANTFRNFAAERHSIINEELSAVRVDAGPDQTAFTGGVVQFDARASRPDPGPGVTYSWSNGMSGDFPTTVFDLAGTYSITLTIAVDGAPFQDTVEITVVDPPESAFAEANGVVVLEAESFHINDRHGAASSWWEQDTAIAGYSGPSYMEAKETSYQKFSSNYANTAPELRYAILFENTGTYRLWFRGSSSSTESDSVHANLDAVERDESFATRSPSIRTTTVGKATRVAKGRSL